MKQHFNQFLLAVQFLTRLPVKRWVKFNDQDLRQCVIYFPLVGALIGVIGVIVFSVAVKIFPIAIAIIFLMLATVIVTGALHEDGLADAADGLGGSPIKERALEIMNDSRLGTYGALALGFAFSFKFIVLGVLVGPGYLLILKALIAAPLLSRCSAIALLYAYPCLRSNSLTSKPFATAVTRDRLIIGVGYTLLVVVLLLGWAGLSCAFIVGGVTSLCGKYYNYRLGGITGDCLGATIIISELVVYLALAAVMKNQIGIN